MKVDSYSLEKNSLVFVVVPAGTSIEAVPLPDSVKQLGPFHRFRSYDLQASESRIGLDSKKAVDDIEKHGFHVGGVSFEVREGQRSGNL